MHYGWMLGVGAAVLTTVQAGNVALNKPVSLNGTFGSPLLAATANDGLFVAQGTSWTDGTLWWTEGASAGATVEIDLEGTFVIESLVVQADDNDAYLLEYYDPSDLSWKTAWDVPNADFVNGVNVQGMQTRPNPEDPTEPYLLGSPILASKLRFSGKALESDRLFSVSEIQAYGYELVTGEVDIKPGSYPNPVNVKAKGVLPVAVLGSDDLDVADIDPATVELAGVSPIRWSYEDVDGDGDIDLSLKFDNLAIAAALGPVADGDVVELEVTAWFLDGSQFVGSDDIWVIKKK